MCQGTLRLNHHRPSIYFCIQGGHGRFSEFTIKSYLTFFRPIHKRARIRDRIYIRKHSLEKVFPDRNTRNRGVWPLSADPPLCPIFSCKSEKKKIKTFHHCSVRISLPTEIIIVIIIIII